MAALARVTSELGEPQAPRGPADRRRRSGLRAHRSDHPARRLRRCCPVVRTTELAPRDRVLFLTDGVVEERLEDGLQFGEARLRELVEQTTADQLNVGRESSVLKSRSTLRTHRPTATRDAPGCPRTPPLERPSRWIASTRKLWGQVVPHGRPSCRYPTEALAPAGHRAVTDDLLAFKLLAWRLRRH
jgi:hypothetical protein